MTTVLDIITLAQKASGSFPNDTTPDASDTQDAFFLLNTLLSEWQLNRWLVADLVSAAKSQSGSGASFTVGPGADFVFTNKPDKIDAAYVTIAGSSPGRDGFIYPFMSRESYDRVAVKVGTTGTPIGYFYDPGQTSSTGTILFWPAPTFLSTLHINAKAYLGQFATLTETITLSRPYISALMWNLAAQLRPIYGLQADPQIIQRAAASLEAIVNSVAQVPQTVQPTPSNRSGMFSTFNQSGPAQ